MFVVTQARGDHVILLLVYALLVSLVDNVHVGHSWRTSLGYIFPVACGMVPDDILMSLVIFLG